MSLSSYMNDIKRRKSACRLAHLRLCRKVTHTKEAENNTLLLAHLRPCRKVAHKEKENKPYQRIGSCTLLLAHLRLFRKVTHTHTHTKEQTVSAYIGSCAFLLAHWRLFRRLHRKWRTNCISALDNMLFLLLSAGFFGRVTQNQKWRTNCISVLRQVHRMLSHRVLDKMCGWSLNKKFKMGSQQK